VNVIPEHTARLVERLLSAYCERICPPTARFAAVLRHRLDPDRATIHELRRICGVPGTAQPFPLAQFRYRAAYSDWTFFFNAAPPEAGAEQPARWRRYVSMPRSSHFVELLREFDADPRGLFWGRVNGKSLRWCRADGRCGACDERYCQVLGIRPALQSR
jgi:hypothetical protein